ncbi:6778_t:CDS:2 [Ambispora gerdemannii]|uniref:Branched-chain-amino-acid aminotransferase n=1 Tax=Ambispora gerdemannii TaxID=144530 RepID=A0A9N8ZTP3_9GLOM|nr:6778_t:CDS:2 [Ambispora gerdemannii]
MISSKSLLLNILRTSTTTLSVLPRVLTSSPLFSSKRFTSYSTGNGNLQDINHKNISVELSKNPKTPLPYKDLVFGRSFTDHMLNIEWDSKIGWSNPIIKPYGPLSLDPSSVVLHYSFECFEGMKAYKDKQGKIRLFRPDMNMKRLVKSANRIALPTFNSEELGECIKELIRVDKHWIPQERGYSLYIRPTFIGTQAFLGVGPTSKALLYVICSPVGPYYKTGFSAVKLLATTENVRAWPGGTGDAKLGGNYAPCVKPQIEAAAKGYQQNLWLFGKHDEITEVGTMNCFVYLKNEHGENELVTPPLDGSILAGVTRDSILSLARSWNEYQVSERKITMLEIIQASEEGRLLEMFGSGTACIVSPIKEIRYRNLDIKVPLDPKNPSSNAGPVARKFADFLMGIQYGEIPHEWSVIVEE